MGEFFQGWRKKVGLVTLLMACMVGGEWLRSLALFDIAILSSGVHTTHSVFSERHYIGYQYYYQRLPRSAQSLIETNWGSNTPSDDLSELFADTDITWYWRFLGFSVGEYLGIKSNGCALKLWLVPYWSLTIPLSLVSIWLLFSKPCNSASKKIAGAFPAEGN